MFLFIMYSDTKAVLKMMSLITTFIIDIILGTNLKVKYQVQKYTEHKKYADLHSVSCVVITVIKIYFLRYPEMKLLLPVLLKRF